MKKIIMILVVMVMLGFGVININPTYAVVGDTVGGAPAGDTVGSAPDSPSIPKLSNPLKTKSITDTLLSIADLMIFLGVILAVLMFIYIGFKFVMAQGNESKITEAKEWFLWAAVGTAVLISSKLIVQVVQNTLTSAGVVEEGVFNKQI